MGWSVKYAAVVIATASYVFIAPSWASNSRFYDSLNRLDPETRLEQVCDLEAMKRIDHDPNNHYHPDRAQTDAISNPRHAGDTITGTGGAFRSKGQWYSFTFTCEGTPDHLRVRAFNYKVGEPIPESKWATYGLWR
jgi:hypothetical protein